MNKVDKIYGPVCFLLFLLWFYAKLAHNMKLSLSKHTLMIFEGIFELWTANPCFQGSLNTVNQT
jgi:hypothetical protein